MIFKIYFWLILVLTIVGIFGLLQYTPFGFIDILGLLVIGFMLFGTFEYVFNKKHLDKKYWKYVFIVIAFLFIEGLIEIFVLPKDFIANSLPLFKSSIPQNSSEILLEMLLRLPAVYAVYKLSSK